MRPLSPRFDLTGKVFGRLTVMSFAGSFFCNGSNQRHWLCRCDCGQEKVLPRAYLVDGTRSCGCLGAENRRTMGVSHGGRRLPEYKIWEAMKRRCANPKDARFADYGGRGIRVCDRWTGDFAAFLGDMGRRPSERHSLDRIDNDGNYEPGNCRWATWVEQRANRRPHDAKEAARRGHETRRIRGTVPRPHDRRAAYEKGLARKDAVA